MEVRQQHRSTTTKFQQFAAWWNGCKAVDEEPVPLTLSVVAEALALRIEDSRDLVRLDCIPVIPVGSFTGHVQFNDTLRADCGSETVRFRNDAKRGVRTFKLNSRSTIARPSRPC